MEMIRRWWGTVINNWLERSWQRTADKMFEKKDVR